MRNVVLLVYVRMGGRAVLAGGPPNGWDQEGAAGGSGGGGGAEPEVGGERGGEAGGGGARLAFALGRHQTARAHHLGLQLHSPAGWRHHREWHKPRGATATLCRVFGRYTSRFFLEA